VSPPECVPGFVHHWRLGSPDRQGASEGECRRCGARRTFGGGMPEHRYEVLSGQQRAAALGGGERELRASTPRQRSPWAAYEPGGFSLRRLPPGVVLE